MNLILKIKFIATCLLFLISLNISSGESKNFDQKDLIEAIEKAERRLKREKKQKEKDKQSNLVSV